MYQLLLDPFPSTRCRAPTLSVGTAASCTIRVHVGVELRSWEDTTSPPILQHSRLEGLGRAPPAASRGRVCGRRLVTGTCVVVLIRETTLTVRKGSSVPQLHPPIPP